MNGVLRGLHSEVRRQVARASRRWSATRVRRADLTAALRRLADPAPPLVLVHSSLSACGEIDGGAGAVIDMLRAWVGSGTLAMPAHSYSYPSGDRPAPVFDPLQTPSVVGAITEAFRRRPAVLRSLHPTHSLAAEGPLAEHLVAGHERCATPCGPGTPYERLVQLDAAVLMFGVTLDAYTLFHTAEDAADVPYLYEPSPTDLRYLGADRREHALTMRRHDMHVRRTFDRQDKWLESQRLLRRGVLGDGQLLWIPHAGDAHSIIVRQLQRAPLFLTVL